MNRKTGIMSLFILAFILMSSLLTPSSGLAHGQPPSQPAAPDVQLRSSSNPACYALDVVFIIDQSGSMSGNTPNHDPANDPLGMRFYSPRYALKWLANNRLGLCPQVVHRVGMVSFGSSIAIDLPMTKIDPVSPSEWESQQANLVNQIQQREMGGTDPAQAYAEANRMLKALPPLGNMPRKRVIIQLTDGKACVSTLGCLPEGDGMDHERYNRRFLEQIQADFPFSPAVARQEEALRQAAETYNGLANIPEEERNRLLSQYPVTIDDWGDSTYIYIIAMNANSPYLDTDGATLNEIAGGHGGRLVQLQQNLIEVPRTFDSILSWLAGVSPTIITCGPMAVDPYLAGAMLSVFKLGEGYEVTISHNGHSITSGQGDRAYFGVTQYSTDGSIESYLFDRPPAGVWQVDATDCDSIQASYIEFQAHVQQVAPVSVVPQYNLNGQTSDPEHPFYLVYRIEDQSGNQTLDQNEEYPLDMRATIIDPNGDSYELNFEFVQTGEWKSIQPLPVHLAGNYQVDTKAMAQCVELPPERPSRCQNSKFQVFRDSTGRYEVGSVKLFDFQVIDPLPSSIVPYHGPFWPDFLEVEPISVRVHLVDEIGVPINSQTVLASPAETAFTATLSAGEEPAETVVLVPDPVDPSLFTAVFQKPAVQGTNTLRVQLTAEYQYEVYSPAKEEITIQFERSDTLLRNPIAYAGMCGIGLALMGLFFWLVLYGRMNPVLGQLIFTDMTTGVCKTVGIARGRRNTVVHGGMLPPGFKKVKVVNAGTQGNRRAIQATFYVDSGKPIERTLVDGGTQAPLTPGWNVHYQWGGYAGAGPTLRMAPTDPHRSKQRPWPWKTNHPGNKR
jgi:hypothetical protein